MNFRLMMVAVTGAMVAPAGFAQSMAQADAAKGQSIAQQVCAPCHGADGNSPAPPNPSLAGQHANYLVKQMTGFKSQGSRPPERSNPVMAGMVANLTVDDMNHLAGYYSAQKLAPRMARDAELAKLGQAIYRGGIMAKGVAACASCHAPSGAGIPVQFPRIAGQHPEYTEAQLKAFRGGERANDPNRMMRSVAAKLSDREIKALAEYIAGLR